MDQNAFTNLSTSAQPINGGVGFAAGIYAGRIQTPNGSACVFTLSISAQPGFRQSGIFNIQGASLSIGVVPDVQTYQLSGLSDGRQYQLEMNQITGVANARMGTGVATGQTIYSFRRLL